jgi:predicted nucleic acid-binding Zn ribbon protein
MQGRAIPMATQAANHDQQKCSEEPDMLVDYKSRRDRRAALVTGAVTIHPAGHRARARFPAVGRARRSMRDQRARVEAKGLAWPVRFAAAGVAGAEVAAALSAATQRREYCVFAAVGYTAQGFTHARGA